MERRIDYRHGLRYELTLTDPQRRTLPQVMVTENVSASGLRFTTAEPHDLVVGSRFEVRMVASAVGRGKSEPMVLSTDATLVRVAEREGAVVFDRPLAY